MTADDHQKMLATLKQESLKDSIFQYGTYGNAITLVTWLITTAASGEIRFMLWLQILVCSMSLYLAGWIGFQLWLFRRSAQQERPFGWRAYVERAAMIAVIGGIFGEVLWLLSGRPVFDSAFGVALAAVLLTPVLQLPLWWSEFNKLRKICVTHL